MWRWMLKGLSGIVGMMLNSLAETEAIDHEQFCELEKQLKQLTIVRDRLKTNIEEK